jgi:hydroxyacylglutathione hydrolase
MSAEIKTISGMANCYLLSASDGPFILIDTGASFNRTAIDRAIMSAGCRAGNLSLIILTHGDMDHSGNGAYLRHKYGAKLAMHQDDAGMVERGDMSWNRKTGGIFRILFKLPFVRLSKANRFTPDFYLTDGQDLSMYGLPGTKVFSLPGHSKGSIGILTGDGELFCGDLFTNQGQPTLNSIIDDTAAAKASVERLKNLPVETVYPGHGKPFPFTLLSKI